MKLAIHICSEIEWRNTKAILKISTAKLQSQPFGEFFYYRIGQHRSIIYQSGATKTRSAAACQFAIDTWHPDAVVNLGTCGGVADKVKKLNIILADKTFQYDVIQRFGKPSVCFKRGLKKTLDISWVDLTKVSRTIYIGTIASADQDLADEHRKVLQNKKVLTADWESASIAKICKLNKIKCLILRGITDIQKKQVSLKRDIQDNDYKKNTPIVMKELFSIIDQIEFR